MLFMNAGRNKIKNMGTGGPAGARSAIRGYKIRNGDRGGRALKRSGTRGIKIMYEREQE